SATAVLGLPDGDVWMSESPHSRTAAEQVSRCQSSRGDTFKCRGEAVEDPGADAASRDRWDRRRAGLRTPHDGDEERSLAPPVLLVIELAFPPANRPDPAKRSAG